jgi:hypothetical protein
MDWDTFFDFGKLGYNGHHPPDPDEKTELI